MRSLLLHLMALTVLLVFAAQGGFNGAHRTSGLAHYHVAVSPHDGAAGHDHDHDGGHARAPAACVAHGHSHSHTDVDADADTHAQVDSHPHLHAHAHHSPAAEGPTCGHAHSSGLVHRHSHHGVREHRHAVGEAGVVVVADADADPAVNRLPHESEWSLAPQNSTRLSARPRDAWAQGTPRPSDERHVVPGERPPDTRDS